MSDELKTFIGEKIGEATMCWEPIPNGVFDSQRAVKILDEIYDAIEAELGKKHKPIKPVPPSKIPGTPVGHWSKKKLRELMKWKTAHSKTAFIGKEK